MLDRSSSRRVSLAFAGALCALLACAAGCSSSDTPKPIKTGTSDTILVHPDGQISDGSDAGVNATFIQPFASYTTKSFTTLGLNTESTYDWSGHQWTVPLNVSVSQLLKVGQQPIQIALGGKYYADGPSGGPEWGLRCTVTLLFPK